MRVLVLFDLDEPARDHDYSEDLAADDWEAEAAVLRALRALGHEVKLFGVCDDLQPLLDELRDSKPDLVFNLAEAFRRDRALEPHLASLLELMGVRYTGAAPKVLQICKDKALTKRIVAHHLADAGVGFVRVPRFEVSPRSSPLTLLGHKIYPALVKPIGLEASAGISRDSFVENEKDCLERVRFVHERLKQDAIIEEYIEGRELYVSAIGEWDGQIDVYPPRELFFEDVPEGDPKFATFKAKWDDDYRKRWGIRNGFPRSLGAELATAVEQAGRLIYRALQITGYARIDLRVAATGELVFLEANPNPSIGHRDDFALSAKKAGFSYEDLIARIIANAQVR